MQTRRKEEYEALIPSSAPFNVGTTVDRYRILRLLGQGGMSWVYLGRDMSLGRLVALKFPHVQVATSLSHHRIQALHREARALANFSHPHIAIIYELGRHQHRPYIAMEYLPGESLGDHMRRGALTPPQTLEILTGLIEALAEAHAHSVAHLDIKPKNILLPEDGRVRMVDFGLARTFLEPQRVSRSGTPPYMAPEQWRRRPGLESDVWALAMLTYELVVGHLPYKDYDPLQRILALERGLELPPRFEAFPPYVADFVRAGLMVRSEDRPSVDDIRTRWTTPKRKKTLVNDLPFRGLLAFEERHAPLFFGRSCEVDRAIGLLSQQPILPIVGPMGVGKSSLVDAGIVAHLRTMEPWVVIRCRPGQDPVGNLARAISERTSGSQQEMGAKLRDAGLNTQTIRQLITESPQQLPSILNTLSEQVQAPVLLVIDPLEELFDPAQDVRVQSLFLEAICAETFDIGGRVRVIFTVREDHLGQVSNTAMARRVLTKKLSLSIPDRPALETMIAGPLETCGFCLAPSVLQSIVTELEGKDHALALLQLVGLQLWKNRDRKQRTIPGPQDEHIQGVTEVLVGHARSVLQDFHQEEAGWAE